MKNHFKKSELKPNNYLGMNNTKCKKEKKMFIIYLEMFGRELAMNRSLHHT